VTDGELAWAAGTVALGDDLTVPRIGFGARWVLHVDPDSARALLRRAVELGVKLIDTADVYGDGGSELMIADALHPYPPDVVVATKGGQIAVDGQPAANGRPGHLRRACEGSLRRLRLERIDLYQLHNADPDVPLEESLGALAELQAEGKIRHIGVSNLFGDKLERALSTVPVVSVQNQFNLTSRASETEIATCESRGLAFMPWAPLGLGALTHPDGELARIAESHGAAPAQVALAWLLQRSGAMLPIPGTSSVPHLEANLTAAKLRLTDDELVRLDALSQAG
jgi:aryl-alcohol dehydrogenase-like predicted oxidoreductase